MVVSFIVFAEVNVDSSSIDLENGFRLANQSDRAADEQWVELVSLWLQVDHIVRLRVVNLLLQPFAILELDTFFSELDLVFVVQMSFLRYYQFRLAKVCGVHCNGAILKLTFDGHSLDQERVISFLLPWTATYFWGDA